MVTCKLTSEHIPQVAELERICFSEPWSQKSLEMLTNDGGVGFVTLCDGEVTAYGGMLCVLDEGQITNIATHPEYRRRGCGKAVVTALLEYAEENALSAVFLEVRRSNESAVALYRACGFCEVGTRKGFYRNPVEDAIIMKKTLR